MEQNKMVFFRQFESEKKMSEHMRKIDGVVYDKLEKAANSKGRAFYKVEVGNLIEVYEMMKPTRADIRINVNQNVKVRFNDMGYLRLASLYNLSIKHLRRYEERNIQYYKDRADERGYTTMPLWSFMQDFGEVTGIGKNELFDADILIESL